MKHPRHASIQPDIFMEEARAANLTPAQLAALIGVPLPPSCSACAGGGPAETALPAFIPAKQGFCTQRDYESLPAALRAQLIDGYIVTSHPVTARHQRIITELLYQITTYLKDTCSPFKCITSPVRLYLPNDPSSVLLPDLALLYHPGSVDLHKVTGLPDFIAEVTSPGSTYLDSMIKLEKYRTAGIREYWIIDWDSREVQAFRFSLRKEAELTKYSTSDRIPVLTYSGLYLDFRVMEDPQTFCTV